MKILIVSRSFYPAISPRSHRTTELAKEFSRQGHQVTVLTPKLAEHYIFEKQHRLTIKDLGQPKWKPYSTYGKGILKLYSRIIKRFLDQYMYYPEIELVGMVKKALKKENGYNLLISIAAPHSIHWGVAKAWKNNHKIADKWIADCGDPFMLSQNSIYQRPFYFKSLEKKFCRGADFITVPVEGAKMGYYSQFRQKIRVIPQGFRVEDLPEVNKKLNSILSFSFAGSLDTKRRNPVPLIEYLLKTKHDFKFFIFTKNQYLIRKYSIQYPAKIILNDYLPRNDLLQKLSEMDFLVNFENKGNTQLPSKLIDYALLKKPILSINGQEPDTSLIDEFLNRNYNRQFIIEDLDQYKIENVTKKFLDLVN